jgi:hypothetical protein
MAETLIEFPTGGTAKISGTPHEIAEILRIAGMTNGQVPSKSSIQVRSRAPLAKRIKTGPVELISDLKAEGFFAEGRAIGEIQTELRARGHIYALTSLSPALIRLVRRRELGRVKGPRGRWVYVER